MTNGEASELDNEQPVSSVEEALGQAAELAASEKASAQVNYLSISPQYNLCA
jgi:hypothetical protein